MENDRDKIRAMGENSFLRQLGVDFLRETAPYKYTYHFTWLGVPIIQLPQDIIAMQEIIWKSKPDLIVELGVAHGGSLLFYSSMLELLRGKGYAVGVDIDIHPRNRNLLENHPLCRRIKIIEGSSIEDRTFQKVRRLAGGKKQVLVALDSNHTHEHVLHELRLYSRLVTKGSYLVVFDTAIEDMPEDFFPDRPWRKGNNPKTAVWEFLKTNDRFIVDKEIENKLLITVAPDGYLRCIKD